MTDLVQTAAQVMLATIRSIMTTRVTFTVVPQPGTSTTFVHAFLDATYFLATGCSSSIEMEEADLGVGEALARARANNAACDRLWELETYRLHCAALGK